MTRASLLSAYNVCVDAVKYHFLPSQKTVSPIAGMVSHAENHLHSTTIVNTEVGKFWKIHNLLVFASDPFYL